MASMIPKLSAGGRALAVGVPSVAAMYYFFWTGLQRSQKRKELRDSDNPASVPTWQHRILQTADPVENADNPATLRSQIFERKYPSQDETKYKSPTGSPGTNPNYSDSPVAKAVYPAGQQDEAAKGNVPR